MNAENPKSKVIPLSLDYGFLSKLAVEATVLNDLQRDVLPESMCPKTPKFIFNIF